MIAPSVKEESGPPQMLETPQGRRLACRLTDGAEPGVVFLTGFRSDMQGDKAVAIERFCREEGLRCLRFDYSGHGRSSSDFMDCTIGMWKEDAVSVIDALAPGRNILVGSSMGGWIMGLAALARPQAVCGLVGIASAPDFTRLIEKGLTAEQKRALKEEGVAYLPSCYGQEPYPITRNLIEEARQHLLLEADWPLSAPVRLLHGTHDEDVPWQTSLRYMERLRSPDITLELVQNGGHRLSDPAQLALLWRTLEEMVQMVAEK